MKEFYTTKELAKALGVSYCRITKALFDDKIEPPMRVGASYLWTPDDIERVSWVVRHRSADDILPKKKPVVELA